MAEEVEETPLDVFSPYGYYSVEDFSSWVLLAPQRGNVIECLVPAEFAHTAGIKASFLVVGRRTGEHGDYILEVRSLGSTEPAFNFRLASVFNRRGGLIHVCGGASCEAKGEFVFHLTDLALWDGDTFQADYVGSAGKKLLKSYREIGVCALEEGGHEDTDWEKVGGDAAPKKAPPKRSAKPAKPKGDGGTAKRGEPDAKDYAHLRARLDKVKKQRIGAPAEELVDGLLDGEPLEDGESPLEVTGFVPPRLGTGRTFEEVDEDLAAMRLTGTAAKKRGQLEDPRGGTMKALKPGTGGVGGVLARTALAATGAQASAGALVPGGGGHGHPVYPSAGGKKKKKRGKKKKKKKKGKRAAGGGDPDSSGSSSTSDDSEGEDDSGSCDSSGSSKYLPPLRKKSSGHPGSVLKLLLDTVEEHLSSIGETAGGSSSTLGGTKVLTYYNSLIKGGVNATSRDGREMYLLAVAIDMLRVGRLAELGDGLSARFLALHQANIDGGWDAARHLEIHTPELLSAAGAQVTLAARKHSRMLDKVKGANPSNPKGEPWRKGGWSGSWGQGSAWTDGKGKTKKGKGKGQGDGWSKSKGRGGGAGHNTPWQNWDQPSGKGQQPKDKKEADAT